MPRPSHTKTFSHFMSQIPTAVSVVTAGPPENMRGMTVGSLTRVSTDPELLMMVLEAGSSLRSHIVHLLSNGQEVPLGISVLTERQRPMAEHFANRLNIVNVQDYFEQFAGATVLTHSLVQISAQLHEQAIEIAGSLLVPMHPVAYRWGLEQYPAPLVYWARTWTGIERIPQESGL